eukprot:TRINITY_DN13806_c0_g1_i1.p1 TRINITY_DN13806_c0_g1~~TRINITY_DN13806_c0_g1_i1.p1  ORF type:complete len:318 (+),score=100.83 TRINITY_DN13806_c0_g1_i1:78-1031(+)
MDVHQLSAQVDRDVRGAHRMPINANEKYLHPVFAQISGRNALYVAGACTAVCLGAVLHAALVPASGRRGQLRLMRKLVQCQITVGEKHGEGSAEAQRIVEDCLTRVFKAYDVGDGIGVRGDGALCRGEAMVFFEDYFRCLSENEAFQEHTIHAVQEMVNAKGASALSAVDLLLFTRAEGHQISPQAQMSTAGAARAQFELASRAQHRQQFVQNLFRKKRYHFTERWFKFCDENGSGDLDAEEMRKALVGEKLGQFQRLTEACMAEAMGIAKADAVVQELLSREPTALVGSDELTREGSSMPHSSSMRLTPFGRPPTA